jgi:hypothetical protein
MCSQFGLVPLFFFLFIIRLMLSLHSLKDSTTPTQYALIKYFMMFAHIYFIYSIFSGKKVRMQLIVRLIGECKKLHCFAAKKNTVEAKTWLDKHYTNSAPEKWTVEWFSNFKRGEMSIEDDARSGRPKEAVTDENIKKVYIIILDDRKVKLMEIAGTLKISKERVRHIVHEYLDLRKLCNVGAVRAHNRSKATTCWWIAEQCLAIFNHNKDEFFLRYNTMDETWLLHYTPESAEWADRDEPNLTCGKM